MFGICHVSVVLLFVRFAFCQSCDCKLVDILKDIVQKEMLEREVLASRVDMLESLLGSGTRNIASSSIMSSEAVILERLGELEKTTENIKTQFKEITTERQKDARLNSALIKAWSVHKLGFSSLTEDIKQSSSVNNKSFHNLLTNFDTSVRLFEIKFEGLLNKSNNEATKQQQAVEVQFDTIRSDLNKTFNDYKSRMDTDIMVFINRTEKQLHAIQTEIINNECDSNPCMNGATCLDGVQRYSCICIDGYNGTNCQTEIDECASNPCKNGATCVDAIDGYSCRCQSGYLYAGNSCQIHLDECSSNPCMNGATCADGLNNYTCRCLAGYSGLHCQIDECSSSPCMNGATCVDGSNKYSCRCVAGYSGLHCQDIDECSSSPCMNGATCVDGLDNYSCRCAAGYSGLHCQIDIDECSSNPCMNGATCVDGLDNYACRCVAGYSGLNCQIDIDECSSTPCMNGATCVDGLDNYACRCLAGYSGLNCQIASGCNSTLTGPAGEVTSANYPNDYVDFTNCYYRISVATGHRIWIEILHFELEQDYDYLRIYDGSDTSSTIIAALTGESLPAETAYISTTNVMLLLFTTDDSVEYSGFWIQYSEV